MLRIATAGSVDDGKSTLIGRLLYDSKAVMDDQWASVERTSKDRGHEYTDLSLVTDGLRAEREQGITIDVAYRYFATPKRKFIIADTPGHIQYTRNMVTGASTAQLAIVLVDARHGLLEQSRRHTFLASLLGIEHIVLAVNKMDLIDWDKEAFEAIRDEFYAFATRLDVQDVLTIPMSALHGDNVVTKSDHTPWYEGPTLLSHLEEVYVAADRNLVDVRFPVQYVIRPQTRDHQDHRSYAGTVASGVMRPGDDVVVLPTGKPTRITAIEGPNGPVAEAFPPMAVSISLADDIDISRGDMIARPANAPRVTQEFDATVCWMADAAALEARARLSDQAHHPDHAGQDHRAGLPARCQHAAPRQGRNGVAAQRAWPRLAALPGAAAARRVHPQRQHRVFHPDRPEHQRDRCRGHGAARGFDSLVEPQHGGAPVAGDRRGSDVEGPHPVVHRPFGFGQVVGGHAGRAEAARKGRSRLCSRRRQSAPRPQRRPGLFSMADRAENLRRLAHVAALIADSGHTVLVPAISPLEEHRDLARGVHADAGLDFVEVFCDTPLEDCERRDPKGLYAKARAGEITHFTGIDSPYQRPKNPDLRLTPDRSCDELAQQVVDLIEARS